ncbi:VHS domain protein [Teladorsagia circumcincta]|uniref:VHS domain protein n=1 Tax=Teladorsagia circumcincta TaxID=45464 RepID=A0A2G9UYR7_TELCI|nr:VHS domain protein [Teladorsagia circumcincta]
MVAMRKRIQHDNPHVVMHALLVLDACVKNCGHKIHAEIATREFMEEFKNLGIGSQYEDVCRFAPKVVLFLSILACWAMAFANKPEYKIVVDTHNLMKLAGFDFPSIKEADAMFSAQVRVCDACYEKISSKTSETKVVKNEPLASTSVKEDISQAEKEKLLKEKEEEDLALALAISQSEAEAKDAASLSSYNPSEMGYKGAAPSIAESPSDNLAVDDPLARYFETA